MVGRDAGVMRLVVALAVPLLATPASAQTDPALPALRPAPGDQAPGGPASGGALFYTQVLGPDAVRAVQTRLHDAGAFAGAVDGQWSAGSDAALRRYQQTRGLQVTGEMNEATAAVLGVSPAALVAASGAAPAQNASDAPAATRAPRAPVPLGLDALRSVQVKLREAGFYNGPVDGVWGQGSQEALVRLQEARGLNVTGRIDGQSVRSLGFDPNAFP